MTTEEERLIGRELLINEFSIKELKNTIELHQQQAFFTSDGKIRCNRCGAFSESLRIKAPCSCGKSCFYCLNCLNMGKIRKCSQLYSLPEKNQFLLLSRGESLLKWHGELSVQQAVASKAIIETIQTNKTRLIWAVAGAGKTEMIFAGIEMSLRAGGHVCIASPRVDVILELAPRLREAFPTVSSSLLYGSSEE